MGIRSTSLAIVPIAIAAFIAGTDGAALRSRRSAAAPFNDVLFIGDSDVEGWPTSVDFPGSTNEGVGGWTCNNVVKKLDGILPSTAPTWVVLVCGENDLDGASPSATFGRFKRVVAALRAKNIRVVYMGTKPEPSTKSMHRDYRSYDAMIRAHASELAASAGDAAPPPLVMVDVYPSFEALGNGKALYARDKLHLSAVGYAHWSSWATHAMAGGATDCTLYESDASLVTTCTSMSTNTDTADTDTDANSEIAKLQSWLDDFAAGSDTVVGISAFVAAGETSSQLVAGDAVVPKAYDTTTKKNIRSARKAVAEDSRFMLASVSKTVVWTALTMMLDAGKFELDDAVDDVLPFKFRNPKYPNVPITYRHVYTHTTGLKDTLSYKYGSDCPSDPMRPFPTPLADTLSGPMTQAKSKWFGWKPGSRHEYSNMATGLAGLLVEKHSGMAFPAFTQKYIFDPLGMAATSWSRPADGTATEQYSVNGKIASWPYKVRLGGYCFVDYPSGQLWSTAGDMAKFARSMLGYGRLPGSPAGNSNNGAECLYSRKTGELAFEPQSGVRSSGALLGWFEDNKVYKGGVGHDGAEEGVAADLYIHLDQNVAVGWMANGELKDKEYAALTKKLDETAMRIGGGSKAPAVAPGCKTVWMVFGGGDGGGGGGNPVTPAPTEKPTKPPTEKPTKAPSDDDDYGYDYDYDDDDDCVDEANFAHRGTTCDDIARLSNKGIRKWCKKKTKQHKGDKSRFRDHCPDTCDFC